MIKRRWVTMQDVAQRANVGKITVSRVIRTPEKVAAPTRERVRQAIRDLGYVPDEAAGALSSNRSRIVGALVSTLSDSVFASTIDGLSRVLRDAGQELLLTNTDYASDLEAAAIRALLGRRPEGLVLTSTHHTQETQDLLTSARVPVVELWDMPQRPIGHVVGFSNYMAGCKITEYLLETSRTHIAFLGGQRPDDHRGHERARGFQDTMKQSGGSGILLHDEPDALSDVDAGARGLAQALSRWPDLDAIVCVSDPVAMGVFFEAGRRGIDVPDRLAITGFGGLELTQPSALNLTTIEFPGRQIGEAAGRILLETDVDASPQTLDLGFSLVRRGTA